MTTKEIEESRETSEREAASEGEEERWKCRSFYLVAHFASRLSWLLSWLQAKLFGSIYL